MEVAWIGIGRRKFTLTSYKDQKNANYSYLRSPNSDYQTKNKMQKKIPK